MPAGMRNSAPTLQNTTTTYQITSDRIASDKMGSDAPDEEYTDQELLSLVNYFEVSRVELKNVCFIFLRIKISLSFYIHSVLIHYLHNQFLKPNKLILKHRNYSKVNELFYSLK